MEQVMQVKSNQILFVTYTWLADVNASVAKCLCVCVCLCVLTDPALQSGAGWRLDHVRRVHAHVETQHQGHTHCLHLGGGDREVNTHASEHTLYWDYFSDKPMHSYTEWRDPVYLHYLGEGCSYFTEALRLDSSYTHYTALRQASDNNVSLLVVLPFNIRYAYFPFKTNQRVSRGNVAYVFCSPTFLW